MARKVPYLVGIDKAKFRRPVVPGDQLMMETTVIKHKLNIGWVTAEAKVDGQLVCSAELMFSITVDPSAFANDSSILHL
jgi:3-hydroxyacyl-[acyl-carrier-protein] dehydratase